MNTVLKARYKTHSYFGTPKRSKIIMSSCNLCTPLCCIAIYNHLLWRVAYHGHGKSNYNNVYVGGTVRDKSTKRRRLGHVTTSVIFIFRHIFPITLSTIGHKSFLQNNYFHTAEIIKLNTDDKLFTTVPQKTSHYYILHNII